MKRSRHCLGLFGVVTQVSLLFVFFLAATAQGQTSPPAFKDVIRGEGAKVWMAKEVTPKKKYVVAVALPNMPDPTWQSVWYGCQPRPRSSVLIRGRCGDSPSTFSSRSRISYSSRSTGLSRPVQR
jgi:hypothetical protein